MKPVIIKVPRKGDKILALRSGSDHTVVAHGRNLRVVVENAGKSGAKQPVFAFIPKENVRYIF
jgi:hypothetical protein